MAIKKISEFTSGIPTASDQILIEQDGAGKSTTISNAVNTCSLTLEEIQATTDLTGKIASASVIKDGVFTIKNVSTAQYIQFGKLVVVRFNATISGDVYTGLPKPSDYFIAITLRDNTNGKIASFYMDGDAVIKTYLAINYTAGNVYSGSFAYFIK